MRPEYIGVKYYSSNDMSIGYNFEQAKNLLGPCSLGKAESHPQSVLSLLPCRRALVSLGLSGKFLATMGTHPVC